MLTEPEHAFGYFEIRRDDRNVEQTMRATLHTDGAARRKLGEPTGPAGIGAVLRSESGDLIGEIAKGIGRATNNVAEYTALIEGLQMALDAGVTELDAFIDSPVVAGHLLKGHRVKAGHLLPLVERVRHLLTLFSRSSVRRVPRTLNGDADRLANQGIDDAIADIYRMPEASQRGTPMRTLAAWQFGWRVSRRVGGRRSSPAARLACDLP